MLEIILFCISLLVGQVLVWLQVSGQLVWPAIKNNIFLAALLGVPISALFIKATAWGYAAFDQQLWSVRLIGFAINMIVFGLMTWLFLGEVPDAKSWVSIALCIAIIIIQIIF